MPKSCINWKLNMSMVSPLTYLCGNLRPVSIMWLELMLTAMEISPETWLQTHLRPILLPWWSLLVLVNLKLVSPRMGRSLNMPFWLTHWVWKNLLLVLIKWIPLSDFRVKRNMKKWLRKSLSTLRKLATILTQCSLCQFLVGMVTVCWSQG